MKTAKWAMGLVLLSTLSAASGQILIKTGVNTLQVDLPSLLTNYPLIGGYLLYALSAAMLVAALKYGELSVLYPIYAMNYIWVSLASPVFFPSDSMNLVKWVGVAAIVAGVAVIGFGSKGGEHG